MRFAVQQLIAGIPPVNRVSYAIECVAEEFAMGTGKLWSLLWVVNLLCPIWVVSLSRWIMCGMGF